MDLIKAFIILSSLGSFLMALHAVVSISVIKYRFAGKLKEASKSSYSTMMFSVAGFTEYEIRKAFPGDEVAVHDMKRWKELRRKAILYLLLSVSGIVIISLLPQATL
ncbi:hypothetical protein K6689_004714 [Vibrio parahaemolyticus]|nr:hypothetical protein [Vibrio parahaemolyticus]EIA1769909.1 hypothetical protein [Vibrio parahaemolyticus]